MTVLTRLVFFAIATWLLAVSAKAEETSDLGFGGPNAVENQVETDFGESWDEWKQSLKDDFGLVLSVDYTAVLLTANETFDNKDGTGGIARLFGTFDLFNVENGTLVYKFEHRHAYGSSTSRWARSATSACRNPRSTTRISARRTCTGGSA